MDRTHPFLKCPICRLRAISGGRKICDRCSFQLKAEAAKQVREEMERRARYKRAEFRPENYRGKRIVAPAVAETKPREWWEVSFLLQNGIRLSEKYTDGVRASHRFDELNKYRPIGLRFYHATGNKRRLISES